eukprot:gene4736-3421_t
MPGTVPESFLSDLAAAISSTAVGDRSIGGIHVIEPGSGALPLPIACTAAGDGVGLPSADPHPNSLLRDASASPSVAAPPGTSRCNSSGSTSSAAARAVSLEQVFQALQTLTTPQQPPPPPGYVCAECSGATAAREPEARVKAEALQTDGRRIGRPPSHGKGVTEDLNRDVAPRSMNCRTTTAPLPIEKLVREKNTSKSTDHVSTSAMSGDRIGDKAPAKVAAVSPPPAGAPPPSQEADSPATAPPHSNLGTVRSLFARMRERNSKKKVGNEPHHGDAAPARVARVDHALPPRLDAPDYEDGVSVDCSDEAAAAVQRHGLSTAQAEKDRMADDKAALSAKEERERARRMGLEEVLQKLSQQQVCFSDGPDRGRGGAAAGSRAAPPPPSDSAAPSTDEDEDFEEYMRRGRERDLGYASRTDRGYGGSQWNNGAARPMRGGMQSNWRGNDRAARDRGGYNSSLHESRRPRGQPPTNTHPSSAAATHSSRSRVGLPEQQHGAGVAQFSFRNKLSEMMKKKLSEARSGSSGSSVLLAAPAVAECKGKGPLEEGRTSIRPPPQQAPAQERGPATRGGGEEDHRPRSDAAEVPSHHSRSANKLLLEKYGKRRSNLRDGSTTETEHDPIQHTAIHSNSERRPPTEGSATTGAPPHKTTTAPPTAPPTGVTSVRKITGASPTYPTLPSVKSGPPGASPPSLPPAPPKSKEEHDEPASAAPTGKIRTGKYIERGSDMRRPLFQDEGGRLYYIDYSRRPPYCFLTQEEAESISDITSNPARYNYLFIWYLWYGTFLPAHQIHLSYNYLIKKNTHMGRPPLFYSPLSTDTRHETILQLWGTKKLTEKLTIRESQMMGTCMLLCLPHNNQRVADKYTDTHTNNNNNNNNRERHGGEWLLFYTGFTHISDIRVAEKTQTTTTKTTTTNKQLEGGGGRRKFTPPSTSYPVTPHQPPVLLLLLLLLRGLARHSSGEGFSSCGHLTDDSARPFISYKSTIVIEHSSSDFRMARWGRAALCGRTLMHSKQQSKTKRQQRTMKPNNERFFFIFFFSLLVWLSVSLLYLFLLSNERCKCKYICMYFFPEPTGGDTIDDRRKSSSQLHHQHQKEEK